MPRLLLVLCLPVLVAACEASTAPPARLSKAEALAALRAIQSMNATAVGGGAALAVSGEASITALEFATDCPAGGRYEATVESGAGTGDEVVLLDLREQFLGCTVTDSGRTWRFDGDPSLRTRITLRLADRSGDATTMTTAYTGAFRLVSEGIDGRCVVALRAALLVEAQEVRVEGTFCGQAITAADAVVLPTGLPLRR